MKLERYKEEKEEEKLLVPTHFTSREGGNWLPYIGQGWALKDLDNAVMGIGAVNYGEEPNPYAIILTALVRGKERGRVFHHQVHSLMFQSDTSKPNRIITPRWDVINGWTTPLV